MTDIATGWTVNRSVKNKVGDRGHRGDRARPACFPFPVLGIDSDNGSSSSTPTCSTTACANKITFTRSRPGNKNDGAHVEQKNWTHVRELVGYLRFDTAAELTLLNRIWELDSDFTNLVLTQQKLVSRDTGRRQGDQAPRRGPNTPASGRSRPASSRPAQRVRSPGRGMPSTPVERQREIDTALQSSRGPRPRQSTRPHSAP